ncbi:hypothetical protein [Leptodesmis sp.]|uniref:hypothetical protein n=1 Tax=Leptodesmis sp. TaxID=3100501 RepID=UPI0040535A06
MIESAQKITNDYNRAEILSEISSQSTKPKRSIVLKQALEAALMIQEVDFISPLLGIESAEKARIQVLSTLIPQLPEPDRSTGFQALLEAVREILDKEDRAQ